MRQFFRNNGLSLAFLGLFILSLAGQMAAGFARPGSEGFVMQDSFGDYFLPI